MLKRKSFSEMALDKYIEEKHEHADLYEFKDAIKLPEVESYFYDDLPHTEVKGFPFASDLADKDGNVIDYKTYCSLSSEEKAKYKLRFHFLPKMHELYIGATGSGKTTTCIEPQLRAISSQKNKPNLFISDPKGEIFEHNVKHLADMGYKIQILNFKDTQYSNCWNPLGELYELQMKALSLRKGAKKISGNTVDPKLKLMAPKEDFVNGYYISWLGMAFPTQKDFEHYAEVKEYAAKAEVSSLANQLCHQMFTEQFASKDPTWSNGAREMYNGFMLGLLDHASMKSTKFTKDMMNIMTLNDLYTLANLYDIDKKFNEPNQIMDKFISKTHKEAADKIELVVKTANVTRRGFLSTAQTMIGGWMNSHIFSVVLDSNIDLDDTKQPVALFIVTRDYDKSDNMVAATLLNLVYRHFYQKAERAEKEDGISGCRPLHFLLDEFANIPQIPDFETKIATARSKNIWFHIFLQSYEQLSNVYNEKVADIIIDNCNQQVFLGCQSQKSKERFSTECGKRTIKGINAQTGAVGYNTVQTPVVPVTNLDTIKAGELYLKRIRSSVIKATSLRSYECANAGFFKDFFDVDISKYTPLNLTNPGDMKYRYKAIFQQQWLKEPEVKEEEEMDDDDFAWLDDEEPAKQKPASAPKQEQKTAAAPKLDTSKKPENVDPDVLRKLASTFKKK